jgi:methionyl aminopeptidase
VNNQVCHNSPTDDVQTVLEEGQAVKIDLGAHVDGYIAVVATTKVLNADMNAPVVGQQADVMQAAVIAGEAAIRKLRPGNTTTAVAAAIAKVAEDFGVNVVEGVLTHTMKRFVIDGNKGACSFSQIQAHCLPILVPEGTIKTRRDYYRSW